MTLHSQIHPTIISLPEYPDQNTEVIQDFFGNRKTSEAEAARVMKKHRRKKTQAATESKKLSTGNGGDGKVLIQAQAKALRDFWAAEGYTVKTKIESVVYDEQGRTVWRIVTDLKNGLPKNYRGPRNG